MSMENLHGRCPKNLHGRCPNENISPPYKLSLKGAGWGEQRQPKMQPSAEIVRVECAKCRRECDLSHTRATLLKIARVECAKCRRERDL